jgi:hypothetical protein
MILVGPEESPALSVEAYFLWNDLGASTSTQRRARRLPWTRVSALLYFAVERQIGFLKCLPCGFLLFPLEAFRPKSGHESFCLLFKKSFMSREHATWNNNGHGLQGECSPRRHAKRND